MGNGAKSSLFKGVKDRTASVLEKYIGKKGLSLFDKFPDPNDYMKVVNPNYGSGREYSINCALVTSAAALQILGYDVEAMPRDKKWRGFDSVFDYEWTPDNFKSPRDNMLNYSGVPWDENYTNTNRFKGTSVDSVVKEIKSQMSTWGDNSFAAINVAWKGGGAHVFIVSQRNGETTFMDFQTHRQGSPERWFNGNKDFVRLDSIGLYRLDNQKIKTSNTKELSKIVKKRGT